MKNGKILVWQFILLVIVVFGSLGFVVNHLFKMEQIEGYGYDSILALEDVDNVADLNQSVNIYGEASSNNATSCNATSCNATSCNATSCNATSGNATSSNASRNLFTALFNNKNDEVVNELTSFKLKNDEVVAGNKAIFELTFKNSDVSSMIIKLYNSENRSEEISGNVLSIFSNPYIIIPANTKEGQYKVSSIILKTSKSTITYSEGNADFNNIVGNNTTLKVTERSASSVLELKNDKITEEDINKISESSKPLEIVLDCSDNTLVKSSIFDAVKKSKSKLVLTYNDHKMTFFGDEITKTKDIEFKITLYDLSKDTNISKLLNDGYVIEFPDNKELPGIATIDLKVPSSYKGSELFVYFYNEDLDTLDVIAKNVEVEDGYIEFSINHNSKFVLSTENLEEEENVVSFFNSKVIYLAVIAGALVAIIVVIIIVLISRKKKRKQTIKREQTKLDDNKKEVLNKDENLKLNESNESEEIDK